MQKVSDDGRQRQQQTNGIPFYILQDKGREVRTWQWREKKITQA